MTSSKKPTTSNRKPSNKNSKITAKAPENIVIVNENISNLSNSAEVKPNIILHLKCHIKDLCEHKINSEYKYNPDVPPEIVAYNKNDDQYSLFKDPHHHTNTEKSSNATAIIGGHICVKCGGGVGAAGGSGEGGNAETAKNTDDNIINYVNSKLKKLKLSLFKNTMDEKKAACFWCTYDFENQPCYIPRYETDNSVHAYGSFCSPECAAAFLFYENVDDSVKFERFHLMNQIYSGIYGYEKNIQPAPNPYYTLSKYYGNLSIEEYRALSETNRIFIVVERPLTRILPELHEEKDKAVAGSGSGIYRVKRQSDIANRPSKNAILKEVFGVTA